MAAATRTYRPLLTGLATENAPLAGAYAIEWQRQINTAWSHGAMAPTLLHGTMMIGNPGGLGAFYGFLFSPANTDELYQFPLGSLAIPNGYTSLRWGMSAVAVGANTCTFKIYVDTAPYRGPSTGVWTAGYASSAVTSGTTSISGTTPGGRTGSLTLPERLPNVTGYSLLYAWVTMKPVAYAAGNTYRIYSLSMRAE